MPARKRLRKRLVVPKLPPVIHPQQETNMQTRRTVAAALSLAGVLVAAPVWAQSPPRVALVMKSLANEFFLTMEEGAKAHQKQHAKEYTLVASGIKDETDAAA